jgi:hypothetical protein
VYQSERSELIQIFLIIGLVALAAGLPGLINLGKAVLLDFWVIWKVLPFFKMDILKEILLIILPILIGYLAVIFKNR